MVLRILCFYLSLNPYIIGVYGLHLTTGLTHDGPRQFHPQPPTIEAVKQEKFAVLLQKALTLVPRDTIESLNLIASIWEMNQNENLPLNKNYRKRLCSSLLDFNYKELCGIETFHIPNEECKCKFCNEYCTHFRERY